MKKRDSEDLESRYIPKQWVGCPLEAEYFGDDRKLSKREAKMASAKDRSKYKKTDREKFQSPKKIDKEKLLQGRVLSIESEGIVVEHEGKTIICKLRGLLKKEKNQAKNLVAVGDVVWFENSVPGEGVIAHVDQRRSVLSRADNLSRRKEQVIAANIDQVIITVSVVAPNLRPAIVDRYIIAAHKGNMTPIIVVNKIDLLDDISIDPILRENEKELFQDFLTAYQVAGLQVIPISATTGDGLETLKKAMEGKASVFSGQSGVGKSSLINALTGLTLRIGKIVDRTNKGAHTTSTTQLLPLEQGGWCIDTPGIRSFGLWDLERDEVEQYFTEIHEKGKKCRFPDCTHLQEEGCAVLSAVKRGKIAPMRYDSYQLLMETISQEHLRR